MKQRWKYTLELTVAACAAVVAGRLLTDDFPTAAASVSAVEGDVGAGLRVVVRSPDGSIQATETIDPNRILIGVR